MPTKGSETVAVRAVRRDDHEQWLPLWHAYNVFYGRSWGPGGEPPVEPAVTAATWGRFFDDGAPLWALVAEDAAPGSEKGRLVGFTHYLFHLGTNHIEPACYLEDLFASEAARGKGVGRALIEAVAKAARAAGAARLYWLTQEHNATARRLYDRVAAKSDFVVYEKAL